MGYKKRLDPMSDMLQESSSNLQQYVRKSLCFEDSSIKWCFLKTKNYFYSVTATMYLSLIIIY